jgi:hypothetical protein
MRIEEAMQASSNAKALLTPGEQKILYELATKVPAGGTIVELGSWMGGSTIMLAAGSESGPKAKVHAVDLFDVVGETSIEYADRVDGVPYFLATFRENIRRAGVESTITPVQASSVPAGKAWSGPPIDLLFVDANHYYHAVRDDFLAWAPHCRLGVPIVFHDYGNETAPGVRKFVDRAVERGVLNDVRFVDTIAYGTLLVNDAARLAKALKFRPTELLRIESHRDNWFKFAVNHGWAAFKNGDRTQGIKFGLQAIRFKAWKIDGWRLLGCIALNRRPS